jgi:hypothetical protein
MPARRAPRKPARQSVRKAPSKVPRQALHKALDEALGDCSGKYHKVPKPEELNDALDALNRWACHLAAWGRRIRDEFDNYQKKGPAGEARGSVATHLDPPPEPFT